MRKSDLIYEKALSDIILGKYGYIGEKFLSIREFAATYKISYLTAVKIYERLKAENILILKSNSHQINDCYIGAPSKVKTLIGVHVRDINSFYSKLCMSLIRQAKKHNFELIIMSSDNNNTQKRKVLSRFISLGCKGVINLNSFNDEELFDFYRLYPLPYVMYGVNPIKGLETDFIFTDNYQSGIMAAKHLVEIDAKKFYYVTTDKVLDSTDERQNGFKNYLQSIGLEYVAIKLAADENDADNYDYIARQLQAEAKINKLGIFCHHDSHALTILNLCRKRGIKVPNECSIIGYDDLPTSRNSIPKLTTFSYGYGAIAESCLSALSKRIKDQKKPSKNIILTTTLIVRESTKKDI